jgi:predicted DNA-binding transcriptional regulator AlpA
MLNTKAGDIIGSTPLNEHDILLTRREAAEYLRRSTTTLDRWASQGVGPKPIKCTPRGVYYRLVDLRRFVGADVEAA